MIFRWDKQKIGAVEKHKNNRKIINLKWEFDSDVGRKKSDKRQKVADSESRFGW